MAKLVFVSLLSLLFVQAIFARTTVTTIVVNDDEPSGRDCSKEVEKMDFKHCDQFIEQGSKGAAMVNFLRQGGRSSEEKPSTEHLKPCCQQLQKVDKDCQCVAFAHVITKQGGGEDEGLKKKELEKAVLTECGLLHCEIPSTNSWRF